MTMPRLMLIILIVNLLVTLGGVGANYWLLSNAASSSRGEAGEQSGEEPAAVQVAASEFQFFAIDKIIVSVRSPAREHYFVLDLVLQAGKETEALQLERLEPMVRNSVVSHLSGLSFEALRDLSVGALQEKIEAVLREDLATRNISVPFSNLLVSKLIVQ